MREDLLPEIIYLVDPCGDLFVDGVCSECGRAAGFCQAGLHGAEGICWCEDRQYPTDIAYKKMAT